MFTAREFLESPPGREKHRRLPEELKADPSRFREEFFTIATNPSEDFRLRAGALLVISHHSDKLNITASTDFVNNLLNSFTKEFSPEKLKKTALLASQEQEGVSGDWFLAYLYCVLFMELAPEATNGAVEMARSALKDTLFDEFLTSYSERAKKRRQRGSLD